MILMAPLYRSAKACGLFRVSEALARDKLRILCYHGFSFLDEHRFRPGLFHTPDVFARRLTYMKKAGYTSVPLGEAVSRLYSGKLGSKDLVITIDDGFYSTEALALPLLEEHGFTATIYVTTYYMQHQNPIFRLAIQYMLWKTSKPALDLSDLLPLPGCAGPTTDNGANNWIWKVIWHGETALDETARVELAREIGRRLDVDYEELAATRRLSLMNETEVRDLARRGIDIQLHTHRHRMPVELDLVRREISDNRKALEPLTPLAPLHLCYPSGVWSVERWPALEAEGVLTATTCEPGLNGRHTPRYALLRFLDAQTTPQITFEAEVSGFAPLLRRTMGRRRLPEVVPRRAAD
jgi:peptidoglycan/xylan/chitin deacetylase (PgdA/CDA1 family)